MSDGNCESLRCKGRLTYITIYPEVAKCVCRRLRPWATWDLSTKGSWNVWNCPGGTTGTRIGTICCLLILQENKHTRVVVKSAPPTLHNPIKQGGKRMKLNETNNHQVAKWRLQILQYIDDLTKGVVFFVFFLVSLTGWSFCYCSLNDSEVSPGSDQLYI